MENKVDPKTKNWFFQFTCLAYMAKCGQYDWTVAKKKVESEKKCKKTVRERNRENCERNANAKRNGEKYKQIAK